jgi:hypothetical protein
MRKSALLLTLLASSLYGVELRTDQPLAPVQYGAAPARQESARVASDGTNFFAVWRTRTASNTVVIGGGRVSPAGGLLDRPSIFLAASTTNVLGYPDVVFVGGNFLVVYQSGTSVFTRRFGRDGRPVDTQWVAISGTSMYAFLATNGKTVLLPTARNRIRMLAADGTSAGPELLVPNAGAGSLSVASNGDRYLIAYPSSANGALQGVIVVLDSAGGFLAAKPIPLADPLFPRVVTAASDGFSFLLSMATNGPVGTMHVDGDGNPGAFRAIDSQSGGAVVATWSGGEYTLVWARTLSTPTQVTGHDIVGARVDAGGGPIDTTPVTISSAQNTRYGAAFASARNGRDTMIITGDNDGNFSNWRTTGAIFSSLPQIDAEPAARRHTAIASSAAEQAGGSVASNGTLSLVTWRESSGLNQAVVRAALIAPDGQLGAPFDLGNAHSQTTTAAASNGRDFLVTWVDAGYQLVARRVTLEGVLDSVPIVVTPYGTPTDALAAGWSGQTYVVVTAGRSAVTLSGITGDGAVAVSRQVIGTSAPVDSPAVSCAADACSITWHIATPFCGFPLCAFTENDVFARTNGTGNLVLQASLTDAQGVTPARSLPATDGRSVFVYSSGTSMFAGRITAGGVVLDAPAVNGGRRVMTSETSYPLQPVAVAYNGLYLVEPDSYLGGHLYWTRIEPEPTPRVTSLINLHESVTLPVTLAASARNTYLVYSRGDDDETLMAPRLFLRTLASPDPQTSPIRRHAAR